MGNQFNTYVWNDGSKDANYWDKLQHHNDWAQYSPAYGFMWDSSEYSTQITALQNALNTYRPALETGSVGVAGVEETLQKLNDALTKTENITRKSTQEGVFYRFTIEITEV